MSKAILQTINGAKELDNDVADYIKMQQDEISSLRRERNELKLKIFDLEYKLSKGWFSRLIFS